MVQFRQDAQLFKPAKEFSRVQSEVELNKPAQPNCVKFNSTQ
jgi:hypothetical protein